MSAVQWLWRWAGIEVTCRMFRCARNACQKLAFVCSRCDRGQIYCSKACSQANRRAYQAAAKAVYQRTLIGRLKHGQRQRRYSARKKVTEQGSSPPAGSGEMSPLEIGASTPVERQVPMVATAQHRSAPSQGSPRPARQRGEVVCSFCGARCGLVRGSEDFLRGRRTVTGALS